MMGLGWMRFGDGVGILAASRAGGGRGSSSSSAGLCLIMV